MSLEILTCEGCGGQCCRNQPSPPGYTAAFSPDREVFLCENDIDRLDTMPAEIKLTLAEFVIRILTGQDYSDMPCIWLDESTGKCKHYEWRPDICREFELGGEDCKRMRNQGDAL